MSGITSTMWKRRVFPKVINNDQIFSSTMGISTKAHTRWRWAVVIHSQIPARLSFSSAGLTRPHTKDEGPSLGRRQKLWQRTDMTDPLGCQHIKGKNLFFLTPLHPDFNLSLFLPSVSPVALNRFNQLCHHTFQHYSWAQSPKLSVWGGIVLETLVSHYELKNAESCLCIWTLLDAKKTLINVGKKVT